MNAIEQLKSVLCDHAGKCSIIASDEDRAIVDRALQALAAPTVQEPVIAGSLSVRYFRGCKSMTNADFDYEGDLPEGDYTLYTTPPAAPVQEPVAWPMEEQPDGSIIPVDPSELPSDYFTTPPAAQPADQREWIETACALIKAADDAAADRDYMLDSDDCIAVLRGTWKAPLANDMPKQPTPTAQPAPVQDQKSCKLCTHEQRHYMEMTGPCRACRFYSNFASATPLAAQPAPVPLTDEQKRDLIKKSALWDMHIHIGWYSAPAKSFVEKTIQLIADIESAHGITQKGQP